MRSSQNRGALAALFGAAAMAAFSFATSGTASAGSYDTSGAPTPALQTGTASLLPDSTTQASGVGDAAPPASAGTAPSSSFDTPAPRLTKRPIPGDLRCRAR